MNLLYRFKRKIHAVRGLNIIFRVSSYLAEQALHEDDRKQFANLHEAFKLTLIAMDHCRREMVP